MTTVRLYINQSFNEKKIVSLTQDQVHYLKNVLRMQHGDRLAVFNGQNGEWLASIETLKKHEGSLALLEQTKPQSHEFDIALCFTPLKKTHTDFLVRQATEIGVSSLYPFLSDRTTSRRINSDRLYANMIEASELSRRLDVPMLNELQSLREVIESLSDRQLFFFDEAREDHYVLSVLNKLKNTDKMPEKWAIIIGPEGGFTEAERAFLKSRTAAVHLGQRVMRADTAAIMGLSILQGFLQENLYG